MRHVVNIGLLLSFFTLATTGVMAFVLPFSIASTRVHIVFGLATLVLVALHLLTRLNYFKNQLQLSAKRKGRVSRPALFGIAVVWIGLLMVSIAGREPALLLVEQGYEARNRSEIVRTAPLAGFLDIEGGQRIVARAPGGEADVALSLTIGFGEDVERPPSLAVWAETTTGTMIETLFIDQALAYSANPNWGGESTPRHHILPLWRHRYTMVTGIDPSGEVDAYTAATPTHSFTLDDYLRLQGESTFVLCVEVNAPNDPNEHFADAHLGQPSLLYTAYVDLADGTGYSLLELTGHGGGAEDSGAIQYDLEQVTSAKRLVDLLLVRTEVVLPAEQ